MHVSIRRLISTLSRVETGRRTIENTTLALLGVILAVAMTWPLALHLGGDIGEGLGDPLLQCWQVAWIGHAFLHQPLHVFQSNTFWPLSDTLAFSDALVGYGPMGLFAQQGPHAALVVYNLLFLFAYALAFFGAYLLARELCNSRIGGLVAGAAFAYAPWRLSQNNHLHVISSGGIPLALFLLLRGYRRRSARFALGGWLVAAWQMTLGFTLGLQLIYLLAVLAAIGVIGWRSRSGPPPERALIVATAIGMCVFAALTVLQVRPYLRVLHDHPEARHTSAQVAFFSPPVKGFLAAPAESFVWADASEPVRKLLRFPIEQSLFPGLTISMLALVGIFGSVYPKRLRLGLAIGVAICAALSLGLRDASGPKKYLMPYQFLYQFAPGWDGVRTPDRINTLTSLGLALLAGAGVCHVVRYVRRVTVSPRRTAMRAAPATVTAVLIAAILVEGLGPLAHSTVPPVPRGQRSATPPLLHLPISFADTLFSYWSTAGFPATVNGWGAFEPTSQARLRTIVKDFPDMKSIAALRRLGVRTVILHPDLAAGTPWRDAAQRSTAQLPVRREVADALVLYRIAPKRPAARSGG